MTRADRRHHDVSEVVCGGFDTGRAPSRLLAFSVRAELARDQWVYPPFAHQGMSTEARSIADG